MDEFNEFKNKNSEIKLMTDYDDEYDFYCKKGLYVIFAEYCGGNNHPIHYDYCYDGNEVFHQWLNKHNLTFDWYNSCICIIYRKI